MLQRGDERSSMRRRVGAAVAVLAALVAAGAWQLTADAAASGEPSELVPITPCRLFDTRPDGIGSRRTPLGADETVRFPVHGANGDCAIPTSATAIAANVTAVGATAPTYLTVFPADVDRPEASNLNPAPGAAAVPNHVTVQLSDDGDVAVYNLAGKVDVVLDVVGYYQPATSSAGPPGVSGYEVVLLPGIMEIGDLEGNFSLDCPDGKKVLGGGVATFNEDIQVTVNSPLDNGTTWVVSTRTFSGTAIDARSSVNVRIVCAVVEV